LLGVHAGGGDDLRADEAGGAQRELVHDVRIESGLGAAMMRSRFGTKSHGDSGFTGVTRGSISCVAQTRWRPLGIGAIRYVGRLISGLVCYLGDLWMPWDKEKPTWHDKMATTVVVPVQCYPVS
jgi:hypothetical protein